MRADLCEDAIRLTRLVVELLPAAAEAHGLLALLLLTDARRPARTDAHGTPISLEDQDRARWDRSAITEGTAVLEHALGLSRPGPFQVHAAIAALHAEAPSWEATDWPQIAALFAELSWLAPSPVVTLNRAAALAIADGPHVGLALLSTFDGDDRLDRSTPPEPSCPPAPATPSAPPRPTVEHSTSPPTPPSAEHSRSALPACSAASEPVPRWTGCHLRRPAMQRPPCACTYIWYPVC